MSAGRPKTSNEPIPSWAHTLRARRLDLHKSQLEIENETNGAILQKMLSRIENGETNPIDISASKFNLYLNALMWTPVHFTEATGLVIPGFNYVDSVTLDPFEARKEQGMRAVERLEVHPDWVAFPVYGSVSAGVKDADPINGQVAYFALEQLVKRGSKPGTVRVYLVNGDCMISQEATRVEKNIAPGDYIAVDIDQKPFAGDVVVAWWPKEEKMVVKRYLVEQDSIILYPTNPAHPHLVMNHEDDAFIIGRVVARTG